MSDTIHTSCFTIYKWALPYVSEDKQMVLNEQELDQYGILFVFCTEYIKAVNNGCSDAYLNTLRKDRRPVAEFVAQVCDTAAQFLDNDDINTTPMLRVYLVLHERMRAGNLNKRDLCEIFTVISGLSQFVLDIPVNKTLMVMMLQAIYVLWCRLNEIKCDSQNMSNTFRLKVLDKWKQWVNKRTHEPTQEQLVSLLLSLMSDTVVPVKDFLREVKVF